MAKFVSDSKIAIEVTALRWIKKVDLRFSSSGEVIKYQLEFEYRNGKGHVDYEKASERDDMFVRVCDALAPRHQPEPPANA